MPLDATANFVRATTDTQIDNSSTTLSVTDAGGFPGPTSEGEYNIVVWAVDSFPRPDQDPDVEIMRVTALDDTNDDLTVSRGQEDTVAAAHPSGSAVHVSATAKMFSDIESELGSAGLQAGEDFDGQGTSEFTNLQSVSTGDLRNETEDAKIQARADNLAVPTGDGVGFEDATAADFDDFGEGTHVSDALAALGPRAGTVLLPAAYVAETQTIALDAANLGLESVGRTQLRTNPTDTDGIVITHRACRVDVHNLVGPGSTASTGKAIVFNGSTSGDAFSLNTECTAWANSAFEAVGGVFNSRIERLSAYDIDAAAAGNPVFDFGGAGPGWSADFLHARPVSDQSGQDSDVLAATGSGLGLDIQTFNIGGTAKRGVVMASGAQVSIGFLNYEPKNQNGTTHPVVDCTGGDVSVQNAEIVDATADCYYRLDGIQRGDLADPLLKQGASLTTGKVVIDGDVLGPVTYQGDSADVTKTANAPADLTHPVYCEGDQTTVT